MGQTGAAHADTPHWNKTKKCRQKDLDGRNVPTLNGKADKNDGKGMRKCPNRMNHSAMTPWEVAVAQADVTGHLILYTQAPIVKKMRVRGVLPGPDGAPTVRIALGGGRQPSPMEVRFYSGGQVGNVLDTPLIGPAVIAEVFSRSQERELFEEPENDPHCTAVLGLTH
ncbi:hypothetical protein ABZ646_16460 [Streptomyces sp. NPDC007162]|uniref:hypothetical protein n=1 Tax=Streptomyces sp. NPDC007162 TaxID=3156917 RepID=UPI0033F083EE